MADEIPVVDGLEELADLVDSVKPEDKQVVVDPVVEDKGEEGEKKGEEGGGIPDDLGLEDEGNGGKEEEVPTDEEITAIADLSKAQEACKVMRKQILDLKKNGTAGEVATSLQAKLDAFEAEAAGRDYTSTEAYKTTHLAPINAVGEAITALATEHGIEMGAVREALLADPKARIALLKANTDDADVILELAPLMLQMDALRAKAGEAINEAKTNYKTTMEAQVQAEQTARTELIDNTIKTMQASHFLLRDSVKNPNWLSGIKTAASALVLGQAKPEELVQAALKAQVADHYLSMFVSTNEKLKEAQNQIDKLRGVRPRNDARSSPAPVARKGDFSKVLTIEELAG